MNLFRLCGDLSHLFAMLILLAKIWKSRSVSGISGKSQMLFFLVFVTRYLDLFTVFISPYNTFMKVTYLLCSFVTCFFIYSKFRSTYNEEGDKFRIEFILVPAVGMAFLVHHDFNITELLWTFSIYLESVAIMPQLQMIAETGEAESITSHYLFALGAYRAFYIINWIYRYFGDEHHYDPIAIFAGIIQTVLYCDFFYLYVTKVLKGKRIEVLP
jgi:ER lumen protein retaining receptor